MSSRDNRSPLSLGKGALGEGGSLHRNKIHYFIIIWEWGRGGEGCKDLSPLSRKN